MCALCPGAPSRVCPSARGAKCGTAAPVCGCTRVGRALRPGRGIERAPSGRCCTERVWLCPSGVLLMCGPAPRAALFAWVPTRMCPLPGCGAERVWLCPSGVLLMCGPAPRAALFAWVPTRVCPLPGRGTERVQPRPSDGTARSTEPGVPARAVGPDGQPRPAVGSACDGALCPCPRRPGRTLPRAAWAGKPHPGKRAPTPNDATRASRCGLIRAAPPTRAASFGKLLRLRRCRRTAT
ncbi:hypothetical protein SAMN05421854_109369 [Amycolatopsis rubida]|uniref:Uncharacterized protein n=1 Tax=Amycolatopsis rubida TaxID=112413 RepID=A0A1I5WRW2_9PSEU|nr:hypothetical protein SAMN05421854_109369 [Amycolatopsis rubida]